MSGTQPSALAAYVSPIDFRIGQTPPTVNTFPEVNAAVADIYAFAQQVIRTFVDTVGIGPQVISRQAALAGNPTTITSGDQNRFYCTVSEDIQPGMTVHFFDAGAGILKARRATAAAGNLTNAFCSHPKPILSGTVGEFMVLNGVVRLNGLIMGSSYFTSTTPGLIANVPAAVIQPLGWAADTQHLVFNIPSPTV